MATTPTSTMGSMIYKQSEATAARRTAVFHMTLAATGADFTGGAGIAMTISKAGGAFAAVDAGTAITELTNGWYKVVHAAADLDTLGCLGVRVTGTLADPLCVTHQVTALDLNVATVTPAAASITSTVVADGALTAAKFATDALTALNVPLTSTVKTFSITANGNYPISMDDAQDTTVELTGTFASASCQIQTTEDPTATSPVWTNQGSAVTTSNAASPAVITGPHNAIRVAVSSATGSTAVALKFTIRKPAI